MKRYETMRCRRIALGWTKERLANQCDLDVAYIRFYEEGKRVPGYVQQRIDDVIWNAYRNMDSIEHYKKKILEMAIEINNETDTKEMFLQISHLLVEAGKLQCDVLRG